MIKTKENKSGIRQNGGRILFIVCFFAYTISYITRSPFSALINSMVADGVIAKELAGTVTTAYMICYGSGQLIFGKLSSRMSPAIFMGVGIIGAGFANIGMALSSEYVLYLIFWAMNGAFNAMLWPSLTRAFAEWLPEKERYDAGVNVSPSIPIGSAMSLLVCSAILKLAPSWRFCFAISGGIAVVSGCVVLLGFWSIRSYIGERKVEFLQTLKQSTGDGKPKFPIKVFLTTMAFTVIIAGIINGTLRDSVNAWIPTVVSDLFGTDASFAAMISVAVPIMSIFGSYIAKAIDKRVHSELKTTGILFLVCSVCAVLVHLIGEVNVYLTVALLAISITATLGVNTMIVVLYPMRFANVGSSGAVTGFLNSTCCFAAGATSTIYGLLAESSGWHVVFLLWMTLGAIGACSSFMGAKTADKISY